MNKLVDDINELNEGVVDLCSEFDARSKSTGCSISASQREGFIYIGDSLTRFQTPTRIVDLLNVFSFVEPAEGKGDRNEYEESIKWYKAIPVKNSSMKDVMEHSGGLSKVIERLEIFQKMAITLPITEEEKSYTRAMYDGFQVIKIFIEEKHSKRTAVVPMDYCVLCWRRVRHSQKKSDDFGMKRRESSYYCLEHHPERSVDKYHEARTALISAVKAEKKEFSEDIRRLEDREINNDSKPLLMYKWLNAFAPKTSLISTSIDVDKMDWQSICQSIFDQTKSIYPSVFEKIKDCDPKGYGSFAQWLFYGVLNMLDSDPNKGERLFWQSNSLVEWTTFDGDTEGWKTLLALFRRYEAYTHIMNRSRPRGPVKGQTVDTIKKQRIRALIQKHENEYGKAKVARIARELSVSRTHVYSVLNEK
jgi:hypothetical protein